MVYAEEAPGYLETAHDEEHCTDLGNARRFYRLVSGPLGLGVPQVRYVTPWARWLIWDGNRWAEDETDEVFDFVADVVQELLNEILSAPKERREELVRWARKTESARGQKDLLFLASKQRGIPVLPEELDQRPWLLATPTGTVDLRTGEVGAAHPKDLITKSCGVGFDPEAECPRWERFLREIMGGSEELVQFLHRAVGYSLTGDTRERCFFLLFGSGRNGKSTFLETLRAVLGDYALKTPVETLLVQRSTTVRNDVARLRGARFVFAAESSEEARLNEGLVKDLTGRETITARFLFKEHFEFKPEFKLWLGTNHKPEIRGTDPAIWDRVRLVPFDVRFEAGQEDRDLPRKLEEEAAGILRWAVEGALLWQQEGLREPEAVLVATEEYRAESDVVGNFLTDSCIVSPQCSAMASDLLKAYVSWAEDHKEKKMSQRELSGLLRQKGFQSKRETGGVRYRGIGLLARVEKCTHVPS